MREVTRKLCMLLVLACCLVSWISVTAYAQETTLALDGNYVSGTVTDEKNPAVYSVVLPSAGYLTMTCQTELSNVKWSLCDQDDYAVFNASITGGSLNAPQTASLKEILSAGTYTLKVWQTTGSEGTFRVKADFVPIASNDTEPNNTMETAMPLAALQQVTGFLGGNDQKDYYKVTAPANGTYALDVTSLLHMLNIKVYDATGKEVKNASVNCYSSTDPAQKTIEISMQAGTYYVLVSPQSKTDAGTYTIRFNGVAATGLQLSQTYLEMEPNDIVKLEATVLPAGAVVSGLKWESSNKSVVMMYDDGRVRSFFDAGVAVITVSTTDGTNLSATCTVVVKPGKAYGITNDSQTMNSIKLGWASDEKADGYRVYKYDTKKKQYVKYKDTKGKSCKVTKLKAETGYKFKVQAYVNVDGKKIFGEMSSAKTLYTAPKKPGTSKITSIKRNRRTSTLDYITVRWKKVKNASSYEVYGKQPGGSYRLLGTVKGTSMVLQAGRGYTYSVKVVAVRNKHKISTTGKASKPRSYNSR